MRILLRTIGAFSLVAALATTSALEVRAEAEAAVALEAEAQRENWFDGRTAPDWLNAFVCVDLVKLGYAPPEVTWGMRFQDGKYVGGETSPYSNTIIGWHIIEWVLVHPGRVEEMRRRSPEAYETLVKAIAALRRSIAEWIPYYTCLLPEDHWLRTASGLTPVEATRALMDNLAFIIQTESEGRDDEPRG